MIGGYQIFDYDGGWGIDAEEWCDRLQKRIEPYRLASGKSALGRIWLPHDARAKTFSAKKSAVEIFLERFGAQHVSITPMSSKADRINAARTLTPRVMFNKSKCERGLDGLRAWSYEYNEETRTFSSEPLHDWASHDGDGYSYGCQIMRLAEPPAPPPEPIRGITVGQNTVTLDELWKMMPKSNARI